ncbi:MFS transporter [Chloroflexota bacterium]
MKRPKKIFYGWWIVLAGMINFMLSGCMYTYGFSAFFLPISNEFGWSRAVMSAPIGVSRLEGALLGPVEGYMVDKFGPRKLMFFAAILVGTAFVLMSRMQSLLMFYLVFLVCLGLGTGLMSAAVQVAVVNWFQKRRGLGLGISMGGINLGAMATPVVVWLIATRGWRGAAFIIGLIMWAVQIPLSLVLRHRPEPYGYLPDNMSEQQEKVVEAPSKRESAIVEQNFTPRQAIRTRTFWLLCIAYGSRMLTVAAIPLHLIPFIQDLGFSAATGGSVMAIMGFSALIGRISVGYLADIVPKRYAFAICMTVMGISVLFLSTAQSVWQLVLWAVLYGPGYGGGSPVMGAMIGDYYGRKSFGTINGVIHIPMAVTTLIGPVFAGYIFDVTGSYRPAFIFFAAVSVIGILAAILARRPHLSFTQT